MGSLPLNHICFSSLCQVHEMMTCGWTSWTYQVSNHFYLTFNVSPKRVIPTSKDGLISFGYHYKRPDYPYMLFWDLKMSWFLNFLRQLLKQKCRFLAVVYKRTYDNVIYILHITELSLMTEIYTKPVMYSFFEFYPYSKNIKLKYWWKCDLQYSFIWSQVVSSFVKCDPDHLH